MDRRRKRDQKAALSVPIGRTSWVLSSKTFYWVLGAAAGFIAVAFYGTWWVFGQSKTPNRINTGDMNAASSYLGSQRCANCHAKEYQAWRGSHHDLAMQEANDKTVLGDFSDVKFNYAGITSRFFRRDGKFFVNTDGADGKLADYEISYAFGVAPLQQYLIKVSGGRMQALSIAWDSRTKEQGGQRWFHLYPNERITHNDELHWTRRAQNWNFMCAECHSTNLEKNYDVAKREYRTSWSEINVSCEACHGPGSDHVVWAKDKSWWKKDNDRSKGLAVALDERKNIQWSSDPQTGNARRSAARHTETEIQLCARCHSRRAQLFGDYRYDRPLMNSHLPALLVEGLYHPDGQIDGEVYEYGSFIQSKMYQAGVTCSDCHDPHTLQLRAMGNALCAQCHSAAKYASTKHHFHADGKAGSGCIDCHMPEKTFMMVDSRRDHSFRLPRPDLSARLGTPNACNGCHQDKSPQWAENKRREWYGAEPKGYQRYAETLHAARTGSLGTENDLIALSRDHDQPVIARATVVAELGNRLNQQTFNAVVDGLSDPDPMVRIAALGGLEQVSPEQRWQAAHKLVRDPMRVVRMRAAGLFSGVGSETLTPAEREDLEKASAEYLAAQRQNADDPAAQVNLGNFYAGRGDGKRAEAAYRTALDLDPNWVPAYVNLADLMRLIKRDNEGERILRSGIARQPNAAALFHSLGLAQVRQKNVPGALASLKRAIELAPKETRYSYVYAVALHSAERSREAMAAVDTALKGAPGDRALTDLRAQLSQASDPRLNARAGKK